MSLSPIDEAMRASSALASLTEILSDSRNQTAINADRLASLIGILADKLDESLNAMDRERSHSLRIVGG